LEVYLTAQVHEKLLLDGVWTSMTSCPSLPIDHSQLRVVDDAGRGQPLQDDAAVTHSTACWRGYVGTWEIKDGRLYLRSVIGRYRLETPMLADWVSEVLRIPQGRLLEYVHMGFESTYEREVLITVKAGIVVDRQVIEHGS
jgi:hypothetical protein